MSQMTYRGRPVDSLTREELIDALETLQRASGLTLTQADYLAIARDRMRRVTQPSLAVEVPRPRELADLSRKALAWAKGLRALIPRR